MNSILHLESILSKVDHLLLDEGLKDFEVHQEGFRKLGELYLLSSLEQHQICDTTTNFVRTQDELAHIFPTVLSGTLSSTWKSVYEDVLRLRDYDSSQNKSDILGSLFQRLLTTQYVQDKGIVFTPQPIVEHILSQVGFQSASFNPVDSLIDLSCGSGIFLARSAVLATRVAVKQGLNISKILDYVSNKIIGFDIDPDAVFISHVNLIDQLLEELGTKFALDYIFQPNIFQTNSLLRNNKADIANVRKLKKSKYDFVVGNPPYVESKIMDKETKKICLEYFPNAAIGHFDIYSCFLSYGSELLSMKGRLGYIIPNKFLSSRYARQLREKFLHSNLISKIIDFSHQNVFAPAVYPIILILDKNCSKENSLRIARADNYDELREVEVNDKMKEVHNETFLKTKNRTIYLLEEEAQEMINRIFSVSNLTLGDLIRFRWAVSFHRKGLRERFISETPRGGNPIRFIGGKAFGGNREINRYHLSWKGYWIDYDHKKAKSVRNNFPDLKYFKDNKIVLCQHALRMRATIDYDGYVCKDIFLIGHLKDKALNLGISLEYILALLNSELYSYLYSNIYSSTEIMGKYLHYLPMFIHDLPFKIPSKEDKEFLEKLVIIRLAEETDELTSTDKLIDKGIYEIYGCKEKEINLAKTHIQDYLVK